MPEKPQGPSWALMLTLLAGALVLASAVAYKLIYPFVHR
jgi:hypothetical protein